MIDGRMGRRERTIEPGRTLLWARFRDSQNAAPARARHTIAYASDVLMIGTALQPHREEVLGGRLVVASVDYAVRFHAAPNVSNWTLFEQYSD